MNRRTVIILWWLAIMTLIGWLIRGPWGAAYAFTGCLLGIGLAAGGSWLYDRKRGNQ